jgi:hypothetical protein
VTGRPWPPPPEWDEPVADWPQVVGRRDPYRHLPHLPDDIEAALVERARRLHLEP